VLFIDDLIDAYCLAWEHRDKIAGQIYNIGGGPRNLLSLLELIALLEEDGGRPVEYSFAEPRPGDQKVFVADIAKAQRDFGWAPANFSKDGIRKLNTWINSNLELFR